MGWRKYRYGPVLTIPPLVGLAAAWKLRLPNVMRAHTISITPHTCSAITIGDSANSAPE